MGCCGGGKSTAYSSTKICVQVRDQVPGRYQRIVGEVTNIVYGYRMDGKLICLESVDLTDFFIQELECTKC